MQQHNQIHYWTQELRCCCRATCSQIVIQNNIILDDTDWQIYSQAAHTHTFCMHCHIRSDHIIHSTDYRTTSMRKMLIILHIANFHWNKATGSQFAAIVYHPLYSSETHGYASVGGRVHVGRASWACVCPRTRRALSRGTAFHWGGHSVVGRWSTYSMSSLQWKAVPLERARRLRGQTWAQLAMPTWDPPAGNRVQQPLRPTYQSKHHQKSTTSNRQNHIFPAVATPAPTLLVSDWRSSSCTPHRMRRTGLPHKSPALTHVVTLNRKWYVNLNGT